MLREAGFTRSGLSWYRPEKDSVLLVNVQSARYSPGPYVNLGVYYFKYGDIDKPDIVDCHVTTRLNRLLSVADAFRQNELLDATNEITDDVRRPELQNMIRSYALPWLEGLARFDEARSFLESRGVGHISPAARSDLISGNSTRK